MITNMTGSLDTGCRPGTKTRPLYNAHRSMSFNFPMLSDDEAEIVFETMWDLKPRVLGSAQNFSHD